MKMTKVFLFLTALLVAGVISVYAGGSLEAAQDVLDILRDASQSGSDTAGVPPTPTPAPTPAPTQTPATAGDGGPTNWTRISDNPFSGYIINAVAYGNGRFVAGAGGIIAYSTDGTRWTAVANTPLSDSIGGIAYGDNRWVAVERTRIAYSTNNGTSWTVVAVDSVFDFYIRAVAWGGGRFVAVSDEGKIAYCDW
jgi:HAMP domain-containing protein